MSVDSGNPVVTRGAPGCTAFPDGEAVEVRAHPVDVVSTLGAGDVFHGALLVPRTRQPVGDPGLG